MSHCHPPHPVAVRCPPGVASVQEDELLETTWTQMTVGDITVSLGTGRQQKNQDKGGRGKQVLEKL